MQGRLLNKKISVSSHKLVNMGVFSTLGYHAENVRKKTFPDYS